MYLPCMMLLGLVTTVVLPRFNSAIVDVIPNSGVGFTTEKKEYLNGLQQAKLSNDWIYWLWY